MSALAKTNIIQLKLDKFPNCGNYSIYFPNPGYLTLNIPGSNPNGPIPNIAECRIRRLTCSQMEHSAKRVVLKGNVYRTGFPLDEV